MRPARLAVAAVVVVMSARDAAAQPDSLPKRALVRRGGIQFQLGGAGLGLSGLSRSLATNGLPAPAGSVFETGTSGYLQFGRVVVAGSGFRSLTRTASNGVDQTSLRSTSGLIDIGFAVVDRPSTVVFPYLGGGRGGLVARIRGSSIGSVDDLLAAPRRGVELSSRSWLVNAGVGFDQVVWGSRSGRPITVGVRAGQLWRAGGVQFRADGDRIDGGPEASAAGPYLRLTLGLGLARRRDALASAVGSAVMGILR